MGYVGLAVLLGGKAALTAPPNFIDRRCAFVFDLVMLSLQGAMRVVVVGDAEVVPAVDGGMI